jgi:hypothetical protein
MSEVHLATSMLSASSSTTDLPRSRSPSVRAVSSSVESLHDDSHISHSTPPKTLVGDDNTYKQLNVNEVSDPPQLVDIPPTAAAQAATEKPKSRIVKPKAPSPPPPPPPPPLLTVRLDIPLGGPESYSVSIRDLSKATGQRNPTPPPVRRDSFSESEPDDVQDAEITKDVVVKVRVKCPRATPSH